MMMRDMRVRSSLLRYDASDVIYGDPQFYTRCHINHIYEKSCSLRIDEVLCANFVNNLLVEKLNLKTSKRQTPYTIRLSKGYEEIQVTEQVLISISIGKYVDEVLCDVVPMETCHILLGQPWQCRRRARYDQNKNEYSIVFNNRWIELLSLNPWDARMDQARVAHSFKEREKHKCENEKKSDNTLVSNERKESECETQTLKGDNVEELVDEVGDHNMRIVNEIAGEIELKEEYHEVEIVEEKGIEMYGIEFENSVVEQVVDVDERAVEPLELNNHQWIFKGEIDRIHDEWYEQDRKFSIEFVSRGARHVIALGMNAEKLWELLIQRGFAECDEEIPEPSFAGHIYLTFFQFCRFIFDPGGNLFILPNEPRMKWINIFIK